MRRTRQAALEVFNNPILIGTLTILVVTVAVYLSYIAENGLPFVPTYNINVDVPNAAELVKNADVRIGGARVGQVLTITPEPATKTWPHPFARLGLALQSSLNPLPSDTHYQVRLASVLGGKYLEIIPGHQKGLGVADGGTLTLNKNPRLDHAIAFVDLDTAFQTFGPKTQKGLRAATSELGDTVAGRGAQFNDAIYSLARLIGPLDNVLATLVNPNTRLSQFVAGLAATTGALAPVAPTITSLFSQAATTFRALDIPALGQTIDALPGTESVGRTVLTNARPVLADADSIVQALKPSASLLPRGARGLDSIIIAATPVFRRVPALAGKLEAALGATNALAEDPASSQVFRVLGSSDLATFGSSAFLGLGAILRTVAQAQLSCNVAGLWVHNFWSALAEGDSSGAWLRFAPIFDPNQTFASATPAPDLHINPYPIEDSAQCQAGNEPYTGTQLIGHPPKTSSTVDDTTPPPGVLEEGRKAGLVP